MSTETQHIACDLGAESGRVILGTLHEDKLEIAEKHRFPTGHMNLADTMRWNVPRLWEEIQRGLAQCPTAQSVSVDSWGVDYAWLRAGEPLLTLPYHYRSPRTAGGYERLAAKISQSEIYRATGIQMMELNTILQLHDDLLNRERIFSEADFFLTIADYFNHLLGGRPVIEQSLASTTQLYDPRRQGWATELIQRMGLPGKIFPDIVPSGSATGELAAGLRSACGVEKMKVVASCSHDTGSAVAAVPAEAGEDWAYLSSGTWSLLGVELSSPLINEETERASFTNEVGYGGSIRFLKNIVGLWILQECRREWEKSHPGLDYSQISSEAAPHMAEGPLIRPDDPRFYTPGGMPQKIADYCQETGQKSPEGIGATSACILRSLACLYSDVLEMLESLTGRSLATLHIVGGGCKNALLNQAAADMTGRRVLAGPVEATAYGNLLIQALAVGRLDSLDDLRRVVRNSEQPEQYLPAATQQSKDMAAKFRALPKP